MHNFVIGQRDEFQETDNIFLILKNQLCQLEYTLPPPPEYSNISTLKPSYLSPELWETIFDLAIVDLVKEFNFRILSNFLLVSKPYLLKFYARYFGFDRLVAQQISVVEKYYRISQTFNLLEKVILRIYLGGMNIKLTIFKDYEIEPMPWNIELVSHSEMVYSPVMHSPLIYNPLKNNIRPRIFTIGPANCFISGEVSNSILHGEYFRLPVVILNVTTHLYSAMPLLSFKFFQKVD